MLVKDTWAKLPFVCLLFASTQVFSTGCVDPKEPVVEVVVNEMPVNRAIESSDPSQKEERSLEQILAARRSIRSFSNEPLNDNDILRLCWAAQGITSTEGLRTAPSAGGLYPLELSIATSTGLYQYDPQKHALQQRSRADLREPLYRAALSQDAVQESPAVFVFTAVYARSARKYGARAERYVHMEAGHAAQNLLLQAVALKLAAVPIGAFDDDQVSEVLRLPGDETPLYLIPVGHPR